MSERKLLILLQTDPGVFGGSVLQVSERVYFSSDAAAVPAELAEQQKQDNKKKRQ